MKPEEIAYLLRRTVSGFLLSYFGAVVVVVAIFAIMSLCSPDY